VFTVGDPLSIPAHFPSAASPCDFDLAINGGSASYVYADLHNAAAAQTVLALLSSGAGFVLHPFAQTDTFGIDLRGYGVEMRPFKYSMEYGVKDTSAVNSSALALGSATDETMAAVNWTLDGYLNTSDFGPRFARFAQSRVNKNYTLLRLLRDVTNTFPLFIPEISRQVPDFTRYPTISSVLENPDPSTILNGRVLSLLNLNIYTLLSIVQQERTLTEILEFCYRMPAQKMQLLFTRPIDSAKPFFLNLTSPHIVWYNDIETDAECADWGDSITTLLGSTLPRVRKNLVNVVARMDFSTDLGIINFYYLIYLTQQKTPVRVGLIPDFNEADHLSLSVAAPFYHVAATNFSMAVSFLLNAVAVIDQGNETFNFLHLTEENFIKSYANVTTDLGFLPWDLLSRTETVQQISATRAAVADLGLQDHMLFVNGHALDGKLGSVFPAVHQAFANLAAAVSKAKLESFSWLSAYDILAHNYSVLSSLDPVVLTHRPVGLGLIHTSRSEQTEFIEFLSSMQWNFSDDGRISAYYLLFSHDQKAIDGFTQFAQKSHKLHSFFAINPPIWSRMAKRRW
jgi:UDP-glucose:glycoprotein glucosyltransferase